MIKHIVMWNLKGETPEEKRRAIGLVQSAFQDLAGKIPGVLHMEIGVDTSKVDYACDVVLYSEFESKEALDAYAVHAEHIRVKQQLADVRIARHQVDYEAMTARDLTPGDANLTSRPYTSASGVGC